MTVKDLIIFTIGTAAGAAVGYFVGKRRTEQRAFEYAEKRIKDMEDYYQVSDPYAREEEKEEPSKDGTIDKSSIEKLPPKEKIPYHKYYNVNPETLHDPAFAEHPLDQGEDGEEEPTPEDLATEDHRKNFDREPEFVSENNLGSVPNYYDSKTLFYYVYDEVFTDEDENEIPDPMLLLGEEFLNSHFMDDDTPITYIRNYSLDTLYEVQKVWASYDETR